MSCGDPHETDCSEVLEEVYLYLDGEMDFERRQLIRQHLDECSPCLRQFGIERDVQALVARCCNDAAPEGLRARVLLRLHEVRLEIGHVEYRAD
ncbi:MAG: mycothiol system anti-sigma-R factor [Actinomycetota bacterium]|nr:mycothiol system anti-sigma-R factor [Actinomycetota bacterium]